MTERLCECGCGKPVGEFSKKSHITKSQVKRFLPAHAGIVAAGPERARVAGLRTHCRKGHENVPENKTKWGQCKLCLSIANEVWKNNNPEKENEYRRKTMYGLSPEQYESLLNSQERKCAICKVLLDNLTNSTRPYIDHDHSCCSGAKSCGKCVRGMLCHHCNTSLGGFRDNTETLNNAIQYLNKFKETQCNQNLSSVPRVTVLTASA